MASGNLLTVNAPANGSEAAAKVERLALPVVGEAAASVPAGRMVLLGCDRKELEAFVQQVDEPAYRGRQIARWIYRRGARSFAEMSDLPASLRARLAEVAVIGRGTLVT